MHSVAALLLCWEQICSNLSKYYMAKMVKLIFSHLNPTELEKMEKNMKEMVESPWVETELCTINSESAPFSIMCKKTRGFGIY